MRQKTLTLMREVMVVQVRKMQTSKTGSERKFHWIEFQTLKDLFLFIVTKSMPGQQFLSVLRYKGHTYAFTPIDESVLIMFSKEEPKKHFYVWEPEANDCLPVDRIDRTKVNFIIQDVVQDTLVEELLTAMKN
jgi:hypothetical protein